MHWTSYLICFSLAINLDFFFLVESAEYPGHSCGMLGAYQCGYGSYCENTHNGLVCRCDYIDCLRNPTGKYYICGSDGNTYESHCHMSFESCKEQKEITISYIGPCTGKDKTTCCNKHPLQYMHVHTKLEPWTTYNLF